jgi:beta-lactam-binding protein with PASTA domain
VIGLRLARAKTKIRRARCAVGRVRRARSRLVGRVIGQSPQGGARKPRGFRVTLIVGRR